MAEIGYKYWKVEGCHFLEATYIWMKLYTGKKTEGSMFPILYMTIANIREDDTEWYNFHVILINHIFPMLRNLEKDDQSAAQSNQQNPSYSKHHPIYGDKLKPITP